MRALACERPGSKPGRLVRLTPNTLVAGRRGSCPQVVSNALIMLKRQQPRNNAGVLHHGLVEGALHTVSRQASSHLAQIRPFVAALVEQFGFWASAVMIFAKALARNAGVVERNRRGKVCVSPLRCGPFHAPGSMKLE